MNSIAINEIYSSVQGESSFSGLPCTFIRTMGCSLRCSYCDTEYAFYEGKQKSFDEILKEVKEIGIQLVELTGGEPLDQKESIPFLKKLADQGYTVLLETSGSKPIEDLDERIHIIMDIKTPSSKMQKKNLWENLSHIQKKDEVKFVIGSEEDFYWSVDIVEKYQLIQKTNILFSPVHDKISLQWLADATTQTKMPIRMQIQMHKVIWAPETQGV